LLDPEDEGSTKLRNAGNYTQYIIYIVKVMIPNGM
jgi:hypothetical protein